MQQSQLEQSQSIDFLSHFAVLVDPRQQGKVGYPLEEILLLVLCCVMADGEGWVEIQKFGQKKLDFLRRFRPFESKRQDNRICIAPVIYERLLSFADVRGGVYCSFVRDGLTDVRAGTREWLRGGGGANKRMLVRQEEIDGSTALL